MKRYFAVILLIVFALIFSGCASDEPEVINIDILYGDWSMSDYISEEKTEEILRYVGFSDAEIALANKGGLSFNKTIHFNEDNTYSIEYNKKQSDFLVKAYMDELVGTLFDNREALDGTVSKEMIGLDNDKKFRTAYAALYDCVSYEDYLTKVTSAVTEGFYDFSEPCVEKGSFTAVDNITLALSEEGRTSAENITFEVVSGTLTITYLNGTEVYNKD